MTLLFACGHAGGPPGPSQAPQCPVCGETRVARVRDAAPTFLFDQRNILGVARPAPPKETTHG